MDDDGKSKHDQLILHSRTISKEEVLLLKDILKINFNLNSRFEEKVKI